MYAILMHMYLAIFHIFLSNFLAEKKKYSSAKKSTPPKPMPIAIPKDDEVKQSIELSPIPDAKVRL